MTDLNPQILEEKAAEVVAGMTASLEGFEIRDANLIETILFAVRESEIADGKLGVAFVFSGSDEEWEFERQRALMHFEVNSIVELRNEVINEKLWLNIVRHKQDVLLHDVLAKVGGEMKTECTRIVLAVGTAHYNQMARPAEGIVMSAIHLNKRFDVRFKPTDDNGKFTLSLLGIAYGGAAPVEFQYSRVNEKNPATEGADVVTLEVGELKFEVSIGEGLGQAEAWDLLYLFFKAQEPHYRAPETILFISKHGEIDNTYRYPLAMARGIPGEPAFLSERFRDVLEDFVTLDEMTVDIRYGTSAAAVALYQETAKDTSDDAVKGLGVAIIGTSDLETIAKPAVEATGQTYEQICTERHPNPVTFATQLYPAGEITVAEAVQGLKAQLCNYASNLVVVVDPLAQFSPVDPVTPEEVYAACLNINYEHTDTETICTVKMPTGGLWRGRSDSAEGRGVQATEAEAQALKAVAKAANSGLHILYNHIKAAK